MRSHRICIELLAAAAQGPVSIRGWRERRGVRQVAAALAAAHCSELGLLRIDEDEVVHITEWGQRVLLQLLLNPAFQCILAPREGSGSQRHRCPHRDAVHNAADGRVAPAPRHWGAAITEILQSDGSWWAVSGDPAEYATPVRFCPFCGADLQSEAAP